MSSLADFPDLVGFFSYSREDDADSHGALSALRTRIQGELRVQLGRTSKTFRLWQDKEAIPSGTLWESEIKTAVGQSVFFIPIITPTVVASPYCKFELESFLAREAELGRSDLVFPILYVDVPTLKEPVRRQNDPVLSLIAKRQYVDWREFRHLDFNSTELRRAVERFCTHIRDALHRSWISPGEKDAVQERAKAERAEAERRIEEARQAEQVQAHEREEDQRRQREAKAEQRRQKEAEAERREAAEQRLREEAAARRLAEEERRRAEREERRLRHTQARPLWPPSRAVLAGAFLVCVVLLGTVGAWLAMSPTPTPVASTPTFSPTPTPAPVTPAPAPVTPPPPAPGTRTPVAPAPSAPVIETPVTSPSTTADRSSLMGTSWSGDVKGGGSSCGPDQKVYLRFQPDHKAQYSWIYPGFWNDGTWSQNGNTVHIDTTSGTTWYGMLSGELMHGTADGGNGCRFTWSVKKD